MNKNLDMKNSTHNGYDKLLMSYAAALEDNSDEIAAMLEELAKKDLSPRDKKQLKIINRDLNRINKSLDSIGD